MLARHGYGVLLFDRRGEGRSDGEPNIFGWGGDEDIKAAVRYLQTRDDVDPKRIGGIGLSVGGELMLEAAAETQDLRAVVSDGAGARTARESIDTEGTSTTYKLLSGISNGLKDATMTIATGQTPPKHLKDLVGKIAPRPLLLIADPESDNGEKLNRLYYKHAKRAQGAVGDPGRRPRQRRRLAQGRVREAHRRLLRPGPFNDETPAARSVPRAPWSRGS